MVKFALTLTILLTSIHLTLFAQREVKGMAYDKDTRKPLEGATVLLFTAEKSILKGQSQSDKAGNFQITNIPPGNFMLTISYMGYVAATIPLSLTEKGKVHTLPLQQTGLQRNAINLAGVSIKIIKPIYTIRKDTIEFSAGDFQTAENASLKNLLQKLPGLTVDREGNFFYMGKQVHELYVDGRAVFQSSTNTSGDPKKISRMLQANLVDKIQIADKKGVDGMLEGGKNEKVINITIKKEMKKGINGAVGAGYGNHDRYNIAANANMFRDDKQVIANTLFNNINAMAAPFSTEETLNQVSAGGGRSNINNSNANISLDLTKKIKLSANYTHAGGQLDNDQALQRDNILPDSNFRYNSRTKVNNKTSINTLFSNLAIQLNERNNLFIDLAGGQDQKHLLSGNTYTSLGGKRNDIINKGNTMNDETEKNKYLNIGAMYIHILSKKQGSISVNINIDHNNAQNNQGNHNLNFVAASQHTDTVNQQLSNRLNTRKIAANVGYTRPLSDEFSVNTGYKYTNNLTKNNQEVFDFDNIKNGYDIVNKDLTYTFQNRYIVHSFSMGLLINKTKLQGQLQISYNNAKSVSNIYSDQKEYQQQINYFAPNLNLTYKINNYKSITLNAARETQVPNTGTALVPVISIQNPLYVQLGNPDLKPIIYNTTSFSYQSYSVEGLTFNTNLSLAAPQNATTPSISSDSTGKQISRPMNVNGNYDIGHSITIGKRFKKSGLTLNYTLNNHYGYFKNIINQQTSNTSDINIGQQLSSSWTYKKLLELNSSMYMSYFGNKYAIQNNTYYDYTMYLLSLSANLFLPLDINFGTVANYINITSQRQQYVIVNTWISKSFLPDKSILLKAYIYDLFRKNQALLTMQSFTYIEQQRNTVLSRYGLLSATWFFGKKKAAATPGSPTL